MTEQSESSEINYAENYVMYLRTVQSSAIRVLIEALKEILTDANIEFTISASVSALDGSEDFNLDDNIIELTIITETVRIITLENSTEDQFVGVNNYTYMYTYSNPSYIVTHLLIYTHTQDINVTLER